MPFRVPTFNVWAEVIQVPSFDARGWSRCQMRGPVNTHVPFRAGEALGATLRAPWEFLFPTGSDVRDGRMVSSGQGDRIYLGGSSRLIFEVYWVGDKAPGFTNEYRLVFAIQVIEGGVQGLARVNPLFEPPDGFTPLPVIGRFPVV